MSRRIRTRTARLWGIGVRLALVGVSISVRSFAQESRPNVLVLIGNDHSAEVFGAYGNPKAKTPNLDRLADTGVRFTRAYTNSPGDGISRHSFLTGGLPHSIGVSGSRTRPPKNRITLADFLLFERYATQAIGEMKLPGVQERSPTHYGFINWTRPSTLRREMMESLPNPLPASVGIKPGTPPRHYPAQDWLNAANLPAGRSSREMFGTLYARRALRLMRRYGEQNRRFLLFVSFNEPHQPFDFPYDEGFSDLFDAADFEPPRVGPDDIEHIPIVFRDLTDEQKRGIIAAYYTSTAFLDSRVGTVLDGLERFGLAENTIVFYISDNGYLLGDHGWFEKQAFFEPAVRVPFIVRWPARIPGGRVTDALVELIDIFPTIADLLDLSPPPKLEGRSLAPLLLGRTSEGPRSMVFSEYLDNEEAMVRDERYKLIYSPGKRRRPDGLMPSHYPWGRKIVRLYDLEADPGEFNNLADDPAHQERIELMKREMLKRFRVTNPRGMALPGDSSIDDELDRFLVPREEWGWLWRWTDR